MVENETQTYAYETNPDSEALLEIKKQELKELKKKAAKDRAFRLANKAKRREIRDKTIDRIMAKLKVIKSQIVYYNRAGKAEKERIDILGNIIDCINNDEDLIEEIERITPVSQAEIESEAVSESEVLPSTY